MFVILIFAGMVIDFGNYMRAKGEMQNAADAAATAGASTLLNHQSDVTTATDTATKFGMTSDGNNQVSGLTAGSVKQTVTVGCDTTYSSCSSSAENLVTVHESASVSTFFLGIIGLDKINADVEAAACAPCSSSAHDIMLVLDRTGSMSAGGKGSNSSIPKIALLKTGLLDGFLPTLDPNEDRVGVVVFPPNTATSGECDVKRNDLGQTYYYDPTHNYLQTDLSSGYADGGVPSPTSPVVEGINCLTPAGTTDYADPLLVAQAALDRSGRPAAKKVVVLISDGAANMVDNPHCQHNSPTENFPDCVSPCSVAEQNATTLKNDGIEIFAIAYGDFDEDLQCDYVDGYTPHAPVPYETGYQAMQNIASDPAHYIADPEPANLKDILEQVTGAIAGPTNTRLVE